jgi:anti-sigma B factor antagonist
LNDLAKLTVEDRDELRVATIAGEIDASNAEDVKAALMADLPNAALGLIADLQNLGYLDSSGIAALFELAERLRQRGQAVAVVVSDGALIRPTIELTGLGSVALLAATGEEAEEHIRARRGAG